jgi:hypothetical protein
MIAVRPEIISDPKFRKFDTPVLPHNFFYIMKYLKNLIKKWGKILIVYQMSGLVWLARNVVIAGRLRRARDGGGGEKFDVCVSSDGAPLASKAGDLLHCSTCSTPLIGVERVVEQSGPGKPMS